MGQTTEDSSEEMGFEAISREVIDEVCRRLASNQAVRRRLPGGGAVNIDRALPFLCVYRRNPRRSDAGTSLFVRAEAAFLSAPGEAPVRRGLRALVERVASEMAARFGGFLLLEIWSAEDTSVPRANHPLTGEPKLPSPGFRIVTRIDGEPQEVVEELKFALERIRLHRKAAVVEVVTNPRNHPPRMTPLLSSSAIDEIAGHVLGLELLPVYRDASTGETYPELLRVLRRGVGQAIKKSLFTYALRYTRLRPQHFYALGRRCLSSSAWEADRRLAEVSNQLNFLLQVTPSNAEQAWREFQKSRHSSAPRFHYRPLPVDPIQLKRRLLAVPTERIEDPTMAHLLSETQDQLERQITMLQDVGTSKFLPGSLQVFGAIKPRLLALALEILDRCSEREDDDARQPQIDARAFARQANREIRHYRRFHEGFSGRAIVRDDIYRGLMSDGGQLLIGRETMIPLGRAEALLQHEVGTHLLTYYNAQVQPLHLLRAGLAGYDALQEGLAVVAEYLAGGLNHARLRLLAARVVAAESVVAGSSFIETFQLLLDGHHFEPRSAYTVTLRVHRGGGLTKDAVYLRGLVEMLEYLADGGELDLLFLGKVAAEHLPVMRELMLRKILKNPPLKPRYLEFPETSRRLQHLRQGISVAQLIEPHVSVPT
jgi:uncharacterized protein (TIGR02421 family)